jgi:hypothetical protein
LGFGPYAGTFSAFSIAADGRLYTTWQVQPGGGWANWAGIAGTAPPGALTGTPTEFVSTDQSNLGAQSIYALGSDNNLYTTWQGQPGGGWAGWTRIGS